MLILTRKIDQAIVINGNTVVRVLGNERWGRVKLGIDAPEGVAVLREELLGTPKRPGSMITDFGFEYGPITVERWISDDRYGYVICVKNAVEELEIITTPKGRRRFVINRRPVKKALSVPPAAATIHDSAKAG